MHKDIVLLGMKDEILPIDMVYINEHELEIMLEFVHKIAYQELLSRKIQSMSDWSVRAIGLFNRYNFKTIEHIISLTKNQIDSLNGCGYKTRKEVYDTCMSYGLVVPHWTPGEYYSRVNYRFTDEDMLER